MSDCYRCEDDRTREARYKIRETRRCVVCGLPAIYELDGKYYCLQHYVQELQRRAKQKNIVVEAEA